MKVKELIEKLQECNPEAEAVVEIVTSGITMGPTPSVPLDKVFSGFDWNSRKVFLYPEKDAKLSLMQEDEWKELIRYKQLVMGLRGKQEIEGLSDVFVTKEKVKDLIYQVYMVTDMAERDADMLWEMVAKSKLEKNSD